MLLELSELAGGLPIAASFAMASGITALREGRRRTSLNEAMHELRRPLQGLALSLPEESTEGERAESCLQMAVAAVERLDREINGGPLPPPTRPVPLRFLAEAAVERWRPQAAAAGRSLSLIWSGCDAEFRAEGAELAPALDNLISNALVHGAGAVAVEVGARGGRLHLVVRDGGGGESACQPWRLPVRARLAGRCRHGHGLRIVRRVAARHGGSFRLRRSPCGTEARLELPLAGGNR
ncbi:MAG TPA: HAMP domain-containing sensor histidine kinase [Solirubrobacterales bacterium]|jgi:signal transduction histidine kinase|nr:HAMP domain-containing sensor histidine kinase [Solirubrobacterales bacterium]